MKIISSCYSAYLIIISRYVTALGMFYLRLVGTPDLIYKTLEPFYSDFRKLRLNTPEGWKIIHMDEFVDELLEKQMAFTISLPLLPARKVLELRGELPPRESVLDEEFEEMAAELEKEESKESESKRVKTKWISITVLNRVFVPSVLFSINKYLFSRSIYTNIPQTIIKHNYFPKAFNRSSRCVFASTYACEEFLSEDRTLPWPVKRPVVFSSDSIFFCGKRQENQEAR